MARQPRPRSVDLFTRHEDFAAQLSDALHNSPWWMVSVAFHVVLALVLGLLKNEVAAAAPKPPLGFQVESPEALSQPPPDEPDPALNPVDPTPLPLEPEPMPLDTVPVTDPEPSSDQDAAEPGLLGEPDGLTRGELSGPSSNNLVGTAGDAGTPFGDRRPGHGDRGHRSGSPDGGRSEDSVLAALSWLAAHQSPDGGWEAEGFGSWCDGAPNPGEHPGGPGGAAYDTGVTGLALLAFLGAGYTQRGDHPFAKTVRRGLAYLKNVQDPEGCFGPRSTQRYVYNHATAALAMVEAYGMTESPLLKGSAQRGLDFLALARNPYFVWRYGVRPGDNDTSVTGWCMMAMKSARLVNEDALQRGRPRPLTLDDDAFEGIRTWVGKMTDPDYGRVGYLSRGQGPARPQALLDRFPADKSESMTAVGILARIFLGEDPRTSDAVRKGADLCVKRAPAWNEADGSIDMYYWYYATLGLYQVGGQAWKSWEAALEPALIQHQHQDGTFCGVKGSWDPLDPWGPEGGRVYSTALLAMCLEVHYRYERVFGMK